MDAVNAVGDFAKHCGKSFEPYLDICVEEVSNTCTFIAQWFSSFLVEWNSFIKYFRDLSNPCAKFTRT